MELLNKTFKIEIQSRDLKSVVTVETPFTIDIDIKKNNYLSSNTGAFKIYNLSLGQRERIRKDTTMVDVRPFVKLYAGYGGNNTEIFNGIVRDCYSIKEGPNIVTFINAFDNGLSNRAVSSRTYNANTAKQTILNDLINDLSAFGISRGFVGQVEGVISRGQAIFDSTYSAINTLTNGNFFVEDMKANVVSKQESVNSTIKVINAERGLIGTPIKQQAHIYFDILFEPRLKIGQKVRLESQVSPSFRGECRVISINHKGTISGGVASNIITSAGCNFFTSDEIYKRISQ